jgi:hypothetical protein
MGTRAKVFVAGIFAYGAILYGAVYIAWVTVANVLIHAGHAGDWGLWWFVAHNPNGTSLLVIPGIVLYGVYLVLLRRWRKEIKGKGKPF